MHAASVPVVELSDVSRTFRPPGEPPVAVLSGVSLTVTVGETLAVLGPSGCGKSTLLNLIGGLDRPDSGAVRVNGRDLTALGDRELAGVRNREIGFVFQLHHLLPQCSVVENVLVPTLAGAARPALAVTRERALALLARVGLQDRANAFPGTLSGGERQRVAVARALINQPRLLLADEPTGALDAESAASLVALLVELNREAQLTLLVVTHSQDVAAHLQRRVLLRRGTLTAVSGENA
jgi:ABC-type lipoprotein export system ATPase subunit